MTRAREDDVLEQRARAGALLLDLDGAAVRAVGVPDRVGAALGDSGEERLGRERPVDRARCAQAVSGDSAHLLENPFDETSDSTHGRH